MSAEILESCKTSMEKRIAGLEKELAKVRTGRASVSIFDGLKVSYYGAPTPITQVATLAAPDARTVTIAPFEKSIIGDIEKAIMKADLGLQPNTDGNIVRIPIPPLTEERRKSIVKSIKKMAEDAKVSLRQARRDANDTIKKSEKSKTDS
jgi:ribosome recycling factor